MQDFHAFDGIARDQRQVLRRGAAKDRVVEAHAVDEMQHGRALLAADDRRTLTRRRLLQENVCSIRQCIGDQPLVVDVFDFDGFDCHRQLIDSHGAAHRGHEDLVDLFRMRGEAGDQAGSLKECSG